MIVPSLMLPVLGLGLVSAAAVADEAVHRGDQISQARITSRALIHVADFSEPAVSPDGRYVAVRIDRPDIDRNEVVAVWNLVRLADGESWPIASGGAPTWRPGGQIDHQPALWTADSKWFYFLALHDEELAIWRAGIDGSALKVTDEGANIESFRLEGEKIVYAVGPSRSEIKKAEQAQYWNGLTLEPGVEVGAPLTGTFPFRGRMTHLRRNSEGLSHVLSDKPLTWKVRDGVSGATREIPAASARQRTLPFDEAIHAIAESSNGAGVAFLAEQSLGEEELPSVLRSPSFLRWSPDFASKQTRTCAHALCREFTQQLAWRPRSSEVLFVTQSASGASSLRAWNPRTDSVRSIYATSGLLGATSGDGRTRARLCPVTAQFAVCTVADSSEPPTLIAIDLDTGAARTLVDPNKALRAAAQLARVENLTWPDRWGREVTGVLVMPPRIEPNQELPLVITSYRCEGFLRGGNGSNVPEHVLAGLGFAALCINANPKIFRSPYPSKEVPAGQATSLQTILDSWESGIEFVARRVPIDKKRVGVSGLSLSGEAVHYAIVHSRSLAAAASNHMAFTDPFVYYFYTGELGTKLHQIYGVPDPYNDVQGVYNLLSPALNVAKIQTPLLVQTAEVEFRPGIQYWYRLWESKRPAEVVVFPEEGHQFWQPFHRFVMNERFVDWFRFWLAGYQSDEPGKADQYKRWRELRRRRDEIISRDAPL